MHPCTSCLYIRPSVRPGPAARFLPRVDHDSMESPADSDGDGATASSAAVCCMCGDHGLPGELFQCGLCRLRLQHRYCSELYPREAAHRSCNWCLKEEPPEKTLKARSSSKGGLQNPCDGSINMTRASGGCSRSAFPTQPRKPVKKPKKKKGAIRIMEQPPAPNGRSREALQLGGGTARKERTSRVRVRRYKLLAEVIC